MSHLTRRGFSLVEVVMVLVLIGVVTAAAHRALVMALEIYQAQAQYIEVRQNVRAAVAILPAELRELAASDGDVLAMSATSIRMRAMRQLGFLCAEPALDVASPALLVRQRPFYGTRLLDPGRDSVLVYYEGSDTTRADDGWVAGRLAAMGVAACPDGAPAWRLTTTLAFGGGQDGATGVIPAGAPIRGFEPVTYLLYRGGDGRHYLGLREGAGATQPLVGPLRDDGLTLAFVDSSGTVTATPERAASVGITLRAETPHVVRRRDRSLARESDSVTTWVALRNNRRF